MNGSDWDIPPSKEMLKAMCTLSFKEPIMRATVALKCKGFRLLSTSVRTQARHTDWRS